MRRRATTIDPSRRRAHTARARCAQTLCAASVACGVLLWLPWAWLHCMPRLIWLFPPGAWARAYVDVKPPCTRSSFAA